MEIKENGDVVLQRKVDIELLTRLDERIGFIYTTMNEIKVDTKDFLKVKTDVSWLKRFFFILITATIIGLAGSIFAIMTR